MTEEEVQGAHNQQPTQGTRGPQGTPRGAQRGWVFHKKPGGMIQDFLQLRQQPGNKGPVTTGCDKDDTGRLETNQTTKIIKNMSLGLVEWEPCEIIAIRKALEGQWSSKSVCLAQPNRATSGNQNSSRLTDAG